MLGRVLALAKVLVASAVLAFHTELAEDEELDLAMGLVLDAVLAVHVESAEAMELALAKELVEDVESALDAVSTVDMALASATLLVEDAEFATAKVSEADAVLDSDAGLDLDEELGLMVELAMDMALAWATELGLDWGLDLAKELEPRLVSDTDAVLVALGELVMARVLKRGMVLEEDKALAPGAGLVPDEESVAARESALGRGFGSGRVLGSGAELDSGAGLAVVAAEASAMGLEVMEVAEAAMVSVATVALDSDEESATAMESACLAMLGSGAVLDLDAVSVVHKELAPGVVSVLELQEAQGERPGPPLVDRERSTEGSNRHLLECNRLPAFGRSMLGGGATRCTLRHECPRDDDRGLSARRRPWLVSGSQVQIDLPEDSSRTHILHSCSGTNWKGCSMQPFLLEGL